VLNNKQKLELICKEFIILKAAILENYELGLLEESSKASMTKVLIIE